MARARATIPPATLRERAEQAIDRLIALLDAIDAATEDREPEVDGCDAEDLLQRELSPSAGDPEDAETSWGETHGYGQPYPLEHADTEGEYDGVAKPGARKSREAFRDRKRVTRRQPVVNLTIGEVGAFNPIPRRANAGTAP